MQKFLITSTPILDGITIRSYLGVVNSNIVIGTNFFSDFAASFTDVFGGSSETYQRKMDQMYETAKNELITKTKKLGGNAIVGFRIEFDEISGKGKSMFMLSATGTACVAGEQDTNNKVISNISKIDSFDLQNEIAKIAIINTLSDPSCYLSEDQWKFIFENPSVDFAKSLIANKYFDNTDYVKQKIEALVSKLDFDDAVSIIYPNYILNLDMQNESNNITTSIRSQCTKLIRECKLFAPSYIVALMDSDLKNAIALMGCEKDVYTADDLKNMKIICEKLDALPDTGRKDRGKTGMFSKEKDIWICENGHKNDMENKLCQTCFITIKGLSVFETEIIEAFKTRTQALSNLMKAPS